MKIDNPFDEKLRSNKGNVPESVIDALVEVTDTLDFAWAAAQSVFEEDATPEHALKICEMMILNINRKRDTQ